MVEQARCIRCREPLNDQGICPSCELRDSAEGLELEERLRKLREEIARERGGSGPGTGASEGGRGGKPEASGADAAADAGGTAGDRTEGPTGGKETSGDDSGASKASGDAGGSGGTERRWFRRKPSPERKEPAEDGGTDAVARDASPSRVYGPGGTGSGIRARELDVSDPRHGSDAVRELLEHRRAGLGKIIGVAGLPRHGKTKLADRLRERYAQRPGADLRYDKTERGEVNIYYVPGRREHHVLVDVAGEDFQALGDYDRDLPALMRRFLWPVLQDLDGLLLLMALPIVWAGWNPAPGGGDRRAEPTERDEIGMREATQRMVEAHRMLLKYALVARDVDRIAKAMPQLGLSRDEAPTRNQVDDAFQTAGRLEVPVALAFSKADLYAPVGSGRSGLYTPDLPGRGGGQPPPLHPLRTDPVALGYLHFPELFEFLLERIRFFTFDFVQALVDRSVEPDPREAADTADASRETLLGAEGLLEFVTRHPWRVPGIGTASALALDRKLNPDRWGRDLLRRLYEPASGREGR